MSAVQTAAPHVSEGGGRFIMAVCVCGGGGGGGDYKRMPRAGGRRKGNGRSHPAQRRQRKMGEWRGGDTCLILLLGSEVAFPQRNTGGQGMRGPQGQGGLWARVRNGRPDWGRCWEEGGGTACARRFGKSCTDERLTRRAKTSLGESIRGATRWVGRVQERKSLGLGVGKWRRGGGAEGRVGYTNGGGSRSGRGKDTSGGVADRTRRRIAAGSKQRAGGTQAGGRSRLRLRRHQRPTGGVAKAAVGAAVAAHAGAGLLRQGRGGRGRWKQVSAKAGEALQRAGAAPLPLCAHPQQTAP